jgi:hypothetical protein
VEEFCHEHGQDPANERIRIRVKKIVPTSLGALQAPAEPLTTLIAVVGLAIGSKRTRAVEVDYKKPEGAKTSAWSASLFYLVRALNRDLQDGDWRNVDWDMLDKAQKDLRRAATSFAKVVRGVSIRRGPGPEEVPPEYMGAVRLIKALRQRGATEKQIDEELAKFRFTDKAITWLKELDLQIPAPPD